MQDVHRHGEKRFDNNEWRIEARTRQMNINIILQGIEGYDLQLKSSPPVVVHSKSMVLDASLFSRGSRCKFNTPE